MAMRTLLILPLLGLLFLPGCIPLYLAGARAVVSTIGGVASGVRAAGTPAEAELPQETAALLGGCPRLPPMPLWVPCDRAVRRQV
jgi:hypothetical protein